MTAVATPSVANLVAELEKAIALVDNLKIKMDSLQAEVNKVSTDHANAMNHAQDIRARLDEELNKRLPSNQSQRVR